MGQWRFITMYWVVKQKELWSTQVKRSSHIKLPKSYFNELSESEIQKNASAILTWSRENFVHIWTGQPTACLLSYVLLKFEYRRSELPGKPEKCLINLKSRSPWLILILTATSQVPPPASRITKFWAGLTLWMSARKAAAASDSVTMWRRSWTNPAFIAASRILSQHCGFHTAGTVKQTSAESRKNHRESQICESEYTQVCLCANVLCYFILGVLPHAPQKIGYQVDNLLSLLSYHQL